MRLYIFQNMADISIVRILRIGYGVPYGLPLRNKLVSCEFICPVHNFNKVFVRIFI